MLQMIAVLCACMVYGTGFAFTLACIVWPYFPWNEKNETDTKVKYSNLRWVFLGIGIPYLLMGGILLFALLQPNLS